MRTGHGLGARQSRKTRLMLSWRLAACCARWLGSTRELLAGGHFQADETTVSCQTDEKTGPNHQAFTRNFSRLGGIVGFESELENLPTERSLLRDYLCQKRKTKKAEDGPKLRILTPGRISSVARVRAPRRRNVRRSIWRWRDAGFGFWELIKGRMIARRMIG